MFHLTTTNNRSQLSELFIRFTELKKYVTRPTQRPVTSPSPILFTPYRAGALDWLTPTTRTRDPTTPFGTCTQGMFFYNVKLQGGWQAGIFLSSSLVHSMHECVNLCCKAPACDVAMLRGKDCYTVQCYSMERCAVTGEGDLQVSYVTRIGK